VPKNALRVSVVGALPPLGTATGLGVKLQKMPLGGEGQLKLTLPPKPPTLLAVQVLVALELGLTVRLLGEQDTVTPTGVMVRLTVVSTLLNPLWPRMVTG
jgi:hypothetical protein